LYECTRDSCSVNAFASLLEEKFADYYLWRIGSHWQDPVTSYLTVVIACRPVVVAIAQNAWAGGSLLCRAKWLLCGLYGSQNSDGIYALIELAVVMET